jgi:DNA-binding NarL/FixJ family response regulator
MAVNGESQRAKIRVFVVDDHPLIRSGLAQLINREPDMVVCGEAEEAQTALRAIDELKPDIVILDISLGGPDGLDVLKTIRATDRKLPILVLSMHDESIYAERALRRGANGYIMKQEATERVLTALHRILTGDVYVSDKVAHKMVIQYVAGGSGTSPVHRSPLEGLSDRELEVLRFIGQGCGTREIAGQLHVSVKTVETYQGNLKDKLALRNSRELVKYAIEHAIQDQ